MAKDIRGSTLWLILRVSNYSSLTAEALNARRIFAGQTQPKMYYVAMVEVLSEVKLAINEAMDISIEGGLAATLGTSNRFLISSQGALLASLATRLAENTELDAGHLLGVYCIIDIPGHDAEVSQFFSRSKTSFLETYEKFIRPTRVLQYMPSVQAFWAALATGAEGPTRVFYQSEFAEKNSVEQASLDIKDGLCDFAMILCSGVGTGQSWGKLIGPIKSGRNLARS